MVAYTNNGMKVMAPLRHGGHVEVTVIDAAGDYSIVQDARGRKASLHNSELFEMGKHNHVTREIRAWGKCPACDAHHEFAKKLNDETVSETEDFDPEVD